MDEINVLIEGGGGAQSATGFKSAENSVVLRCNLS
jgi:hypothetical protein